MFIVVDVALSSVLFYLFCRKKLFLWYGRMGMALYQQSGSMAKKITIFLFEWRSALGMRRVALASAESNAAPSEAKPVAARPAGKRPKKIMRYIIGLFNQNRTVVFDMRNIDKLKLQNKRLLSSRKQSLVC